MTSRHYTPYWFVMRAFIVLGLIVIYPMIYNVINSTFSTPDYDGAAEFIGLKNYQVLLRDPRLYDALRLTILWTVSCTCLQYIVGLAAALLLNRKLSILRWVRPFYILPWIIPGVVAAMAFRFMYASDVGLINVTMRSLGLGSFTRAWIANPDTAMGAAILLGVWKGFPFYMIILLAGLQNIPVELTEAARIDGANPWQVFRHITFPLLIPISSISILLGVIATSNYFDGIYLLTGGGPARATQTLPIYIYNVAFSVFDLPKASAASVVLLILVVIFASVYLFITQATRRRNA